MARYRTRFSDRDRKTRTKGYTDFINVENRRTEEFPEEFADGAYGAPETAGPSQARKGRRHGWSGRKEPDR